MRAFLSADVHLRRRDRLSGRIDAGNGRGVPLDAGGLAFHQFTVGHSHLTMYGFVNFAIWGGIYALLPAATGKYPGQVGLALHFWMALVGSFIYVISLSIGGTIQGLDWMQRIAVHSVGHGHAAVLCLARRRRLADVSEPCGVRLERLAHDASAPAPRRCRWRRALADERRHEQAGADRRWFDAGLCGARAADGRVARHHAFADAAPARASSR